MMWILFALGAALAWGLYGPALHRGQVALGNPMRALLCVGVAYFLIGVLVPVANLSYQGQLNGFTTKGSLAALAGGALGAIGSLRVKARSPAPTAPAWRAPRRPSRRTSPAAGGGRCTPPAARAARTARTRSRR